MTNKESAMKKFQYEVSDLGMDHAQYFQGFGSSFTDYDNAVCGVGDTYNDALDDALEMLSQSESLSGGVYEQIFRHYKMDDARNAHTSASAEDRLDVSNSISPHEYIEADCDHEPGEFCEACHDATVESILEENCDWDNERQYYVGILYTIIDYK